MGRPLTYDRERLARAGAQSLDRIEGELSDEKRFNYDAARKAEQDARAEAQAVRSDKREERLTESEERLSKIQQYHFEKEKRIDANADKYLEEKEMNAAKASDELQSIRTDDPDARLKLAEWRHNNFRLLHEDPKIGDKRLIAQADLNEKLISKREETALKLAEEQKKAEALKALGFAPSSATVDGITYTQPKAEKPEKPEKPDSYEEFNKDLEQAKKAYTDQKLPPFIQKAFEDRGKRLEAQTQGATAPPVPGQPAAPAAPAVGGANLSLDDLNVQWDDAATAYAKKNGEITPTGFHDNWMEKWKGAGGYAVKGEDGIPIIRRPSDYKTDAEVKAQYKAGAIPKEMAVEILRKQFGLQ